MATSHSPGPHAPLSAAAVLGNAPHLPVTDPRECWPCGGSGFDLNDQRCDRCDGHGKTCVDCYGFLADSHPDTNQCEGCTAIAAAGLTTASLEDEQDPADDDRAEPNDHYNARAEWASGRGW